MPLIESNVLLIVVIAAGVFAVVMLADRRRYAFVVVVRNGKPELRRGKVTPVFIQAVRQLCDEFGVQQGWVGGVREQHRIRLVFARSVSSACRQRFRNLWQQIGWGGPPQ